MIIKLSCLYTYCIHTLTYIHSYSNTYIHLYTHTRIHYIYTYYRVYILYTHKFLYSYTPSYTHLFMLILQHLYTYTSVYIYLYRYLDDQFLFGIHADALNITGSKIPDEPMYLLLNTAVSSTWGFPAPCPVGMLSSVYIIIIIMYYYCYICVYISF